MRESRIESVRVQKEKTEKSEKHNRQEGFLLF
jgi:hypothetical protein